MRSQEASFHDVHVLTANGIIEPEMLCVLQGYLQYLQIACCTRVNRQIAPTYSAKVLY